MTWFKGDFNPLPRWGLMYTRLFRLKGEFHEIKPRKGNLQGGAANRGLKRFFSMHRSSRLFEAYVCLKSTGWCGLDPWLTIHSILT
jgi:hypothetical protein